MSKVRGNAEGVVEWSRRDPWRERMGEMVEKHLRKACDLNDIDIYDLPDEIGDAAMAAFDCAFEDCCTVTWEDGSNLCTDYLNAEPPAPLTANEIAPPTVAGDGTEPPR